ncbi:hypothetical protein D9613_009308 [Agrocybe pediades]|uniref:EamA domain-containing protein n=1 Tax=Agrocybe pediades TaxID=84607 RepID=A0A8H4VW46_9AGAR|nr:hypothetical protein D9613_009308 [Agrocybe pediades]
MTSRYVYSALPTPDRDSTFIHERSTLAFEDTASTRNQQGQLQAQESQEQDQVEERTFGFQEGPDGTDYSGYPMSRAKRYTKNMLDVFKDNSGLLLVLVSQAFFSMMDTAVKKLHRIDPPVTTLQLMIVRMVRVLFAVAQYTSYAIYHLLDDRSARYFARIPDPLFGPKEVRSLLALRGIGGSFGLFGLYYSLQYLSLSDATVLTFLVPSCVAIAAYVFLKEEYSLKQALCGMVSLAGVLLIARPEFLFGEATHPNEPGAHYSASDRLIAVGVALIGVLGSTLAYTSIRAIGKRAHPMHAMVAFSVQCVVVSVIGMIITSTPFVFPTRAEWLALLFMIGAFGFLAQTFLTMGLQREAAGRSTIAMYTQVIFAMILEYIFFHTYPLPLSLCGAFMIIVSALYVAISKNKETRQSHTQAAEQEGAQDREPLSSNSV